MKKARPAYYRTPEEAEAAARREYYRPRPVSGAFGSHGVMAGDGGLGGFQGHTRPWAPVPERTQRR